MKVFIKGVEQKDASGKSISFPAGLKAEHILAFLLPNNPNLKLEEITLEGGVRLGLDSVEKMDRLKIPATKRPEYLEIVKIGKEFETKMADFIADNNVNYIYNGIDTEVHVGSGIYVQNPDSVPDPVKNRIDKKAKKDGEQE